MRTLLDAVPDIDVIDTTDNGMEAIVLVRTRTARRRRSPI